jgi:hypothetical protein
MSTNLKKDSRVKNKKDVVWGVVLNARNSLSVTKEMK